MVDRTQACAKTDNARFREHPGRWSAQIDGADSFTNAVIASAEVLSTSPR
jgi:hypothetical protein